MTIENDTFQDLQKIEYVTIRPVECTIISRKKQCRGCKTYRQTLMMMRKRFPDPNKSSVRKNRPASSMSRQQIRKRLFIVSKKKTW